jgi:hypothetical protein
LMMFCSAVVFRYLLCMLMDGLRCSDYGIL